MADKERRKVHPLAIVGIVLLVVLVAACVALLAYRDGNLHAEERLIQEAHKAGFVEKQALIGGVAVNYAEGPDNGPAVLLVHGQGMEWEDYSKVLPDLAKRFHVFAIDCFGHGESEHDPALYTCKAIGDATIAFAREVIGGPYVVSGHSSGGILAAYIAANDPGNVQACVLEDPPFFSVLPSEVQPNEALGDAGAFVWYDGYVPAHEYVESGSTDPYPAYYAERSYLFGLFGGLQGKLASDTRQWCAEHPGEHVVTPWIPRDWTRGMYFMDDFDPAFGDAFHTESWFAGIDQERLLRSIQCPAIYLKAETSYGDDGVLYAANTDEDAARVAAAIPQCETRTIKSGHNIHYEHPDFFTAALSDATAK